MQLQLQQQQRHLTLLLRYYQMEPNLKCHTNTDTYTTTLFALMVLPQLTVYAKIIYLLMVVISGALCTVEDYVIMSQCAHNKAIYLAAEGTVSVTDISQTQNITIVGRPDFVNNNFKIALYAKETQRYLCFNDHWKLIGMKELQDTCYFNEAIVHGYFVFRSVVDLQRRIGFTQRGRAVGPKKTVNDACYMFTKIPTDQFFHQHNHYSSTLLAPKSTKTPRPEHSGGSSSHLGRGSGAGSGGGRPKANRHRTQQHRSEEVGKAHNKKPKTHGGNRKRQHQQRLQQMRGGGGGGSGHSSSDPKNSTYLNSSRQNVELSQYGGHNNHTGKHHNNNHSQPQAHHQSRHHHTSEARRHHHDAKQKAAHHRQRLTSTSPETATSTTTSTTATPLTSEQTAVTSTKLKLASSHTDYADIKPTSVAQAATTVPASATTSMSRDVLGSTVAHKRKGRRRKPHRKHTLHKSEQQQHEVSHSRHGHGHATMPAYDDEEYMTTDFTTWINSEVSPLASLASVKPTSASLPTWETWYPSSVSPTLSEESSDYSSTLVPLYEKKEAASRELEASAASLAPTLEANPLPLMPLPLPTSPAYSTSLSGVDDINGVISPVTVTDRTTTTTAAAATTNTSTFQESEAWLKRHHEKELTTQRKHSHSQALSDEVNITSEEIENVTATAASASDGDTDDFEVSESITELNALAMEGTAPTAAEDRNEDLMASGWASTKSTEPHEPTAQTHTVAAESEDSSSNAMTDYIYGNRANHKVSRHRHNGDHGAVSAKHQHSSNGAGSGAGQRLHHTKKTAAAAVTSTVSTTTTLAASEGLLEASPSLNYQQALRLDALLTADKNFNAKHSHNTVTDPEVTYAPSFSSTAASSSSLSTSASSPAAATTTRKTLRKSTQRLLATPFHQLTYVRNEAGDIDIDSLDNISIYPDLLDNDNVNEGGGDGDDAYKSGHGGSSRFTMISGYLPTSATATLPESIRIAKIKINRERKRMLRLRNIGGYNA